VVLRSLEGGCRNIIVVAVVYHYWYTCAPMATHAPSAVGGGALPKVTLLLHHATLHQNCKAVPLL